MTSWEVGTPSVLESTKSSQTNDFHPMNSWLIQDVLMDETESEKSATTLSRQDSKATKKRVLLSLPIVYLTTLW